MKVFENYKSKCIKGEKLLAVLIDPDQDKLNGLQTIIKLANEGYVDLFLVGGSLLFDDQMEWVIKKLKKESKVPVVIFPGNAFQINENADAIFFLSLISGRNADLLIGQHVISAPKIAKSDLDVISTGYMLIDGGKTNTVRYMSNTNPIPANKPEIAVCTALAGEMLGMKQIYMDAGSGAEQAVSLEMIARVKKSISIPLIIGGGVNTAKKVYDVVKAGADIVVVGSAFETKPTLIKEMHESVKNASLDYYLNK